MVLLVLTTNGPRRARQQDDANDEFDESGPRVGEPLAEESDTGDRERRLVASYADPATLAVGDAQADLTHRSAIR